MRDIALLRRSYKWWHTGFIGIAEHRNPHEGISQCCIRVPLDCMSELEVNEMLFPWNHLLPDELQQRGKSSERTSVTANHPFFGLRCRNTIAS